MSNCGGSRLCGCNIGPMPAVKGLFLGHETCIDMHPAAAGCLIKDMPGLADLFIFVMLKR